MRPSRVLAVAALALVIAAQAVITQKLGRQVAALAKRMERLEATPAADADVAVAVPPRFTQDVARPDPPPSDPDAEATIAQLRRIVAEELRNVREQQRQEMERSRREMDEKLRASVAADLALSDAELRRLDDLGAVLSRAEEPLFDARTARGDAAQNAARVREQAEAELRGVLGDARYQKLASLRRNHPELGRSIYVLRTPPPDPATTANP